MSKQSEDELRDFLAALEGEASGLEEKQESTTAKKRAEHEVTRFEREETVHKGILLQITVGGSQAVLHIEPGALRSTSGKRSQLAPIEQAIQRGLEQLGIVVGRREENILQALRLAAERETARVDVVVAEGIDPVEGAPQKIFLLTSDGHVEEELDLGRRHESHTLSKQKVLRIEPSIPPINGKNIFGEEKEGAEAASAEFAVGDNLSVETGGTVVSSVEGTLVIADGRADVIPCDRDGEIVVEISKDKMTAYLSITAALGDGQPVYVSDAYRLLKKMRVIHGVRRKAVELAVQKVLKSNATLKRIPVARGEQAKEGVAATVSLAVHIPESTERYWIKADGEVDFYNLQRIVCVEEGEKLAEVVLGEPGVPGKDVLGQTIEPAELPQSEFLPGDGINVSDDGRVWTVGVSGQIHYEGKRVSVRRMYLVDGDVDFNTGNVDFIGDVLIRGDVADGFSIRSGGDITVTGSVGVAQLEAKGSIEVGLGVVGKNRGTVRCDGNLLCSFLQETSVRCGGNLVAAAQILHSDVRVSGTVEVITAKGIIVGGTVLGGHGIQVKTLGSEYETKTEVEVGSDWRALEESMETDKTLKDLEGKRLTLMRMQENLAADADPSLLARARQEISRMQSAQEHTKRRQTEARLQMFVEPVPEVKVYETAHPGVTIRIRDARFLLREETGRGNIGYDKEHGKITIRRR